MSLPNYLAKIKSSGIYRFVWDKSEITATDAETLRLVVGYSEKGPFNTPVYIDNPRDFKTIFGDVNKKLEKRGIFFHRLALQALLAGPILALNVKKFADEKVGYATATTGNAALKSSETNVMGIYNTSRFWHVDPEVLSDLDNADPTDKVGGKKQYITVAMTDGVSSSSTFILRPSFNSSYDVTIKTWYSTIGEEMPDYFIGYEDLLVSDFLVEAYVFKGQFTPELAKTVELSKYFDVDDDIVTIKPTVKNAFGQEIDALDALAASENSQFVQKYVGVTIPYFKDTNGAYMSLDILFNKDYEEHKMVMKFNSDLLDDGSNGGASFTPRDIVTVHHTDAEYFDTNQLVKKDYTSPEAAITRQELNCNYETHLDKTIFAGKFDDTNVKYYERSSDPATVKAVEDIDISKYDYQYCYLGSIVNGTQWTVTKGSVDTSKGNIIQIGSNITTSIINDSQVHVGDTVMIPTKKAKKVAKVGNINTDIEYVSESETQMVPCRIVNIEQVVVGADTGKFVNITVYHDDFINEKSEIGDTGLFIDFDKAHYMLTQGYIGTDACNNHIIKAIDKSSAQHVAVYGFVKRLNDLDYNSYKLTGITPTYLKGYEYADSKPKSSSIEDKLAWQKRLLDAINPDSTVGYPGLVEALTNRTDVDYRYLVDTFESYPSKECKGNLALLAKTKDNCMLLSNFPAIKSFIKMNYVDHNGTFNVKYIKDPSKSKYAGGDAFSLPSAENGASWCSFNTPVVFTDGTVKTTVPAAALVSNKFMEKYSTRQPYYIVAGPTYGRLLASGLVGPDYNFSRADLDILEPMGVNATVYVPRKGTFINSNQTAKQTPVTALSKINVRELVIYLQDQIHDLLQNYQWEFNTQSLRDLIKSKADSICELVRANGGIYAFSNVCDETNNTDDVINNEMIVLSTFIEPGMGAGKMVQELTIYKKGGMTSTIQ